MNDNREVKKDSKEFFKGMVLSLCENPSENDSLKRFRSCLDRMGKLPESNQKRINRVVVCSIIEQLERQIPIEECNMTDHQYTPWEEVEYTETNVVEDLTSREGDQVCKPWELPDGMRTYLMQKENKTRWERYCTRCGRFEYSYIEPKLSTEEVAQLKRRQN